MTIVIKRMSIVSLTEPISDLHDRAVLAMSTLIGGDAWLIEAPWDGMSLGDVQIYRNMACPNGNRVTGEDGKPRQDDWVWWGGVPRSKIRWYRFDESGAHAPKPATLGAKPPFDVADAERKEKSRAASKAGPAVGSGQAPA